MTASHECGHSWEPVSGWYGRYRCKYCRKYGYKQGAISPGFTKVSEQGKIVVYKDSTLKGKWRRR